MVCLLWPSWKITVNCLPKKGLSIEENVKNIELLLDSQALPLAKMEDLEDSIQHTESTDEEIERINETREATVPPKIGEFVIGVCEDSFFLSRGYWSRKRQCPYELSYAKIQTKCKPTQRMEVLGLAK